MLLGVVSCGKTGPNSSDGSSFGSSIGGTSIGGTSGGNSSLPNSSVTSSSEPNSSTPNVSSNSSINSSSSTPTGDPLPMINHMKVFVKADTGYVNIYAWNTVNGTNTEYLGAWPGIALEKYDDTWLTYDFDEGLTSVNLIFNKRSGNAQTADLSISGVGYHWYDKNKWSHSDIYGGDFSSNPGGGGGGQTTLDPVEADSYKDFSIWNDLGDDYFKVLHPYKGERTDFRDETIYFAITTRFYDGDKSNNVKCWDGKKNDASDPAWRGDFKGLIEKLDYIKALGFTAVWITPVVENASRYDYHGITLLT